MATTASWPAIAAAVVGTLLVTVCAALGAVQILVLNPLAAVPGASLAQIQQELAAHDESLGTPFVLAEMGFGVLLAIALLFIAVRIRLPLVVIAGGYLWLLILATPPYFLASFGAGMRRADTFGISGGDYSPWAWPIYLVSALATGGLVAILVISGVKAVRNTRPAVTISGNSAN